VKQPGFGVAEQKKISRGDAKGKGWGESGGLEKGDNSVLGLFVPEASKNSVRQGGGRSQPGKWGISKKKKFTGKTQGREEHEKRERKEQRRTFARGGVMVGLYRRGKKEKPLVECDQGTRNRRGPHFGGTG